MAYRHDKHAGNRGDVCKHLLLHAYLQSRTPQTTPLLLIDSHAGAGHYRLSNTDTDPGAWRDGIGSVMACAQPLPDIADFLKTLGRLAPGSPDDYPGSPLWLANALRPQDRLCLIEQQADVYRQLQQLFATAPQTECLHADAYAVLPGLIEQAGRDYLLLLDPPYTKADELPRLQHCLQALYPAGRLELLLWYPLDGRRFDAEISTSWLASSYEFRLCWTGRGGQRQGCAMRFSNVNAAFRHRAETLLQWLQQLWG